VSVVVLTNLVWWHVGVHHVSSSHHTGGIILV